MKYIIFFLSLFLFACSKPINIVGEVLKNPIQEKKVILALGDSLTAGYGVEEKQNYPSKLQKVLDENGYNYLIINGGISGDTSENIKSRASLYLEKKPEIVILVLGGNDGLRGLSTVDLKKNILDIMGTFSGSKIVLGGMEVPVNLGEKYGNDFKNVYSEIANERKNIYFLKFFLGGVAGKPELNNQDMIHPNSKGYDVIIKHLFDFLKKNKVITK